MEVKSRYTQLASLSVISMITFLLCLVGSISAHAQIFQEQHQPVYPVNVDKSKALNKLVQPRLQIVLFKPLANYQAFVFSIPDVAKLIHVGASIRQRTSTFLSYIRQTKICFDAFVYSVTKLA